MTVQPQYGGYLTVLSFDVLIKVSLACKLAGESMGVTCDYIVFAKQDLAYSERFVFVALRRYKSHIYLIHNDADMMLSSLV